MPRRARPNLILSTFDFSVLFCSVLFTNQSLLCSLLHAIHSRAKRIKANFLLEKEMKTGKKKENFMWGSEGPPDQEALRATRPTQ
jgi:hypothetical protein